ncbi:MAG: LLM class flavin-dependent oxidoreductase [Proteobacteria bacterium]|nr:LLM class flavin-dependent oxidoreductase [Pseudomonadota bacterium]
MTDSADARSLVPGNYLKFGIFLAPFHAMGENPTMTMERDMQLLEHLDMLGYHEAWIGEHHSGGYELIACPEMFIAGAAERTKHIRLGTGVVSLPYHHPFTVAGRMVQLDHMTRGRCMFGVGPGALTGDAYRMGIDPEAQRRMMNESLDVVVRLLDGDSVTEKTDWFELRDAHLQLRPYTQPRTEMAVACARSPSGALAAGKHGLGMLSIGGTSDEALVKHAENWRMCEEAATENGKTVHRKNWRLVTMMHIAETREKARENVQFGLESFAQYFRDIATFPIIPAGIDDPYEWLMESKNAIIGTPDDAIEYIETLLKGAGGFGSLMQLAHNWADFDATKRNYELISRYVFPHFQRSNDMRDLSYDFSFTNRDKFVGQAANAIQSEIDRYQARKKGEATD